MRQTKIAADDTLSFYSFIFDENKAWCFMWILCLAEDSHEISNLIFSEKKNEKVFLLHSWLVLLGLIEV